ncbi:MAG TPA: M28 family metallopeptidase [bacterium]|nr:M28 family metallopeptidase [bacterium]HQI49043.1 M28 family metallopeptidase [bacterium]HQJ65063.1 M28 family metallopeptidase [bacterium]
MRYCKLGVILFLIWVPAAFAQSGFSADSVYAHIRYLCEEIGPRPMGSPQEQQALAWVAGTYRRYGADSAWVMPFTRVARDKFPLNTSSGIAVGLFKGASDTCLAVGGHADSAPGNSPGANDNASGTATALELARLWSQRPRRYTMIFLCFGGEESGLYGSQYFVDQFSRIDSIGLMISADMTGGAGPIYTLLENRKAQAPRWLVRDAFRINRTLDVSPLTYPVHFSTFNSLTGGAGSDHDPFLAAGIPAIDFTTGLNNSPIHSGLDTPANLDRAQLGACGRFIDALLSHYQEQGLPGRQLDHYTLYTLGRHPLFIPHIVILLLLAAAVAVGTAAFISSRRRCMIVEKALRIRFSPFKLALLFLVIAVVAQGGEALIQLIKGVRYPWLAHPVPYLLLMLCWAVGGLWLALQISRRWHWNPEPHLYASRALLVLAFLTAAAAVASARLALYPGLSLLFFSLALLVRPEWLQSLFGLLAPLPLLRLVFSEVTAFIGRNLAQGGIGIDAFWKAALVTVTLTLLLLALFLPFIYAWAALVLQIPRWKRALTAFRRLPGGAFAGLLLTVATSYACRLPAYDDRWQPEVLLESKNRLPQGETTLTLRGNDYFHNVQVRGDSLDLHFSGRTHKEELPLHFKADWMAIAGAESRSRGEQDTVVVDWLLRSRVPWEALTVAIRVDTLGISGVESLWKYRLKKGELTFTWRNTPPDSLCLHARFLVHPRARVIRDVMASYDRPPVPLAVTAEQAVVRYRTTISVIDTLTSGGGNARGGAGM